MYKDNATENVEPVVGGVEYLDCPKQVGTISNARMKEQEDTEARGECCT